jgi:hypothetical protein
MIDGKEVSSLTYDTEKITIESYLKALSHATQKSGGITGVNIKLDAGAHLVLGMYAVIAENPQYDITDIERVSGSDIIQLVDVGMAFIIGREVSTTEPSEKQSEIMPKPTTRTSSDSAK